jgi:hypothetical protein
MSNNQHGPLIETSAGRMVRSFTVFVNECIEKSGDASTYVRDLAEYEWNHGRKDVRTVLRLAREHHH